MEIPASFQTAIASKLYTDTITVREQTEQLDAEGGAKRVVTTATGAEYSANVQPLDAELRKALLGESMDAEYRITAPADIAAEKGTLIEYNGNIYEVVDFKRYDSHAELLAKRWVAP